MVACNRDPVVDSRTITVHIPLTCAPMGELYGVYYGWGDFQPTTLAPAQSKLFLRPGTLLPELPEETRALVLDASDLKSGERYFGVTRVPPTGDVDILLWASGGTCALTGPTEPASDRLLGVLDDGSVLVTAGRRSDDTVPPSFVVDLTRGTVKQLSLGLLNGRTRARVDAFGLGAVVSGGIGVDDPKPLANAEVFDPKTNQFVRPAMPLSEPRSDHGSVRLASGDVLLVGGVGTAGVLRTMDRLDAKLGQASKDGLRKLELARKNPIVLRLGSGEIMVAGGIDGVGQPVGTLEFFSADALTSRPSTATIPARAVMDCAATDGGGAVCVMAPKSGETNFINTWIISADRGATRAQNQITVPLTDVRLIPGANGSPVLWTGSTLLRWDPWEEKFAGEVDALGSDGPDLGQPMIAADSGLLLWLGNTSVVVGRRYALRTDYTTDPLPYATSTLTGLAPDRSPISSGMSFSATNGLNLPPDTTVMIADLRFRDFTFDVDLLAGEGVRAVLRAPDSPDVDCTLPGSGPVTLHVERRGASVVASAGATSRSCPDLALGARVAVGLRGGGASSVIARVRNIRISR